MSNTQTLIAQAHSAFNHREIESALALMNEDVSWPKSRWKSALAITTSCAWQRLAGYDKSNYKQERTK